ncbi:glycine--tRNA ligase subunit beta [Lampropedia puyangensis]|uniref:Glycine--tRNA ligase beta subunit n=1 Tax=Lampropedia puyangensis TaxID=1330072 RepID=A0A4V4GS79_9BURK|nr:glycine--tRNA ligase subunit beta [Lampropedia puyangensis]THU04556.1 glycine--tRNA ligase subunit beta [Lampropedia puyangensis]
MTTENLLVELFVEELPPKALRKLGDAFAQGIVSGLQAQGLLANGAAVTSFATPRRLAVHIAAVSDKAQDKPVSQKLMPVSVGLKDGVPTPALVKKLAALGLDAAAVDQLKREGEGKSEALFLDSVQAGATLQEGLQKALEDTIRQLPIPKVMTYQLETGVALPGWDSVQFVRPAHGLVALHGQNVVPVSALGLQSGNTTHGHRFEAQEDPIVLQHADRYAQQLREQGAVIAHYDERLQAIQDQLQAAAAAVGQGSQPVQDQALLEEVNSLVERPNVLTCQFEPEFLQVPQECLILTMKANQKYFPLLAADGKLTNQFLVVSNISPADASAVIEGNERVVRPRLADAKFFFDQDRKKSLESRLPQLAKVVYHNKLGTQGERVERVRAIARSIAEALGVDAAQADLAAQLAKTDLVTDMVGEFPELQGTMGRYYAVNDGLPDAVADAIEDHYKPRFAGDALPRGDVGVAVALADKLETLVGMFGIGNLPTGDKDPFALRRHALGVIRMLVEKAPQLALGELLTHAHTAFVGRIPAATEFADATHALSNFIYERLAGSLREQGYSAQEVDAVLALQPQRLADVAQRLQAVRVFAQLPEAQALAAANKRVGNILKKAESQVQASVQETLLQEDAEKALYSALQAVAPQAQAAYDRGDYTSSLQALAALKAPVDAFFDTVMVNAEDAALKANRLGLLKVLQEAMNRVADLSRLAS